VASIDKRPNGRYRARWRDYPGGPQHAKHFDRKVDARRFLDRIGGDLVAGSYIDPFASQVPFGKYAESWRHSQAHRPATVALVETYLRRHIVPFFGSRPLGSIRPSDVQAWANSRATVLAPATLKAVYRFMAAIFNAAVRDRLIAVSPCNQIKLPPVPRRQVEPLGTDAIERLASEMPTRYRTLVLVAAASGLRQGEMFGLEVRHLDLRRATIRVEQQLVTVGSESFIGPPKTSTSVRTAPVSALVVKHLEQHLSELGLSERDRHRLVFTNELGAPIKRNRFSDTAGGDRARRPSAGYRFPFPTPLLRQPPDPSWRIRHRRTNKAGPRKRDPDPGHLLAPLARRRGSHPRGDRHRLG
jgi:integrase